MWTVQTFSYQFVVIKPKRLFYFQIHCTNKIINNNNIKKMWYSFWAAQIPLCRWRLLTLIDWFCGFCGESRIERVTSHVNSRNLMMPQKIWGLKPEVPVRAGASELQADEELDSKLVIMHSGGGPAVRMCFIPLPPPCAAVVQHCIILAVKARQRPRDPSTAT